ncbi:MAG: MBL fold metallo-hydrolase, partial [Oscillospiraceae bacterium]|nr:MBL fold metallo-hydrolase [Oscillospiraceae bacterium]
MGRNQYQRNRKERVSPKAALITVLIALAACFMVFVLINDNVLHIEGVPTTKDVLVALGFGEEPNVPTVEGEISVYFVDVGQGDCELIVTPDYNVMIDCGEREKHDDVLRYLDQLGIEKLDYVIATHPHSDHIGGMADILREIPVKRLIMPYIPDDMLPSTACYTKMMEEIADNNVSGSYANAGEQIYLGAGTYLEMIAPVSEDYDDLNDYSVVVRLVHGGNSFLFTGDIETPAEQDILEQGGFTETDVLKAAHHGSRTSSCVDFLKAVRPKYAIICAAEDNSYGHPHQE